MGGVVTDTNCQRASQSLYETIAVSLFARLPPRGESPLARDSCSATFSQRIFEQKRDCSQSKFQTILMLDLLSLSGQLKKNI